MCIMKNFIEMNAFSSQSSHYEIGSNYIVSALAKLILDFYDEHKFLPKVLHLNCDNCGRENKGGTF